MQPKLVFNIDLVAGYLAAAVLVSRYLWPRLRTMEPEGAQRLIAAFNSFRYLGLAFLLPGFVGAGLPVGFTAPAAYGDLLTGLIAIGALMAPANSRSFWFLVWGFNLVGLSDLILDTVNAVRLDVPSIAGQFGATYWIPVIYVPLLVATHVASFLLLVRHPATAASGAIRQGSKPMGGLPTTD